MTSPEGLDDRLDRLFEIALGGTSATQHSEQDFQEVLALRELFDTIDQAWILRQEQHDAIRAAFLQRLAEVRPDHPWLSLETVRTVGDLARACPPPSVLDSVLATLSEDTTPVTSLLDPTERLGVVSALVRQGAVEAANVRELIHWLNQAVAGVLAPSTGTGGRGLVFTRRQRDQDRNSDSPE